MDSFCFACFLNENTILFHEHLTERTEALQALADLFLPMRAGASCGTAQIQRNTFAR